MLQVLIALPVLGVAFAVVVYVRNRQARLTRMLLCRAISSVRLSSFAGLVT